MLLEQNLISLIRISKFMLIRFLFISSVERFMTVLLLYFMTDILYNSQSSKWPWLLCVVLFMPRKWFFRSIGYSNSFFVFFFFWSPIFSPSPFSLDVSLMCSYITTWHKTPRGAIETAVLNCLRHSLHCMLCDDGLFAFLTLHSVWPG